MKDKTDRLWRLVGICTLLVLLGVVVNGAVVRNDASTAATKAQLTADDVDALRETAELNRKSLRILEEATSPAATARQNAAVSAAVDIITDEADCAQQRTVQRAFDALADQGVIEPVAVVDDRCLATTTTTVPE